MLIIIFAIEKTNKHVKQTIINRYPMIFSDWISNNLLTLKF